MRDPNGYRCSHDIPPYLKCWECEKEERDLRREDDFRETLIHLTAAFNRMADAVEKLSEPS